MVYYVCFPRGRRNKDKDKRKDKTMSNINAIKVENLATYSSRKSFYGRAKVKTFTIGAAVVEVLVSYDTAVAAHVTANGTARMFRLYDEAFFEGEIEGWNYKPLLGYSVTTGNHLAAFYARNNAEWKGKAAWCKLEPVTLDEVFAVADKFNRKAA